MIVQRGPATPQERWEETDGYSPSTIAAEIAGLVAAADIARVRGDTARAALWPGVADDWQRKPRSWMFTTNGPLGDGHYYVRIDNNGDPNDGSLREFANAAGLIKENKVVDAGFLDLVAPRRQAARRPVCRRPRIAETDASLATDTRAGGSGTATRSTAMARSRPARRGSFSGNTKGRPWPLLAGERGEYEVAKGATACPTCKRWRTRPTTAT